MPKPVDNARAIIRASERGEAVRGPLLDWVAAGLRASLAGTGVRMDAAMGLATHGGAGGLCVVEKREARDALLRQVRERIAPYAEPREAARRILNLRDRRTRDSTREPTDAGYLIDAAVTIGLPIPGERQLAAILGNPRGS